MQQIHMIAIKYLTLLMLNKQKLENHCPPSNSYLTKYKQQNTKNESYNMLPKPTQIILIMG